MFGGRKLSVLTLFEPTCCHLTCVTSVMPGVGSVTQCRVTVESHCSLCRSDSSLCISWLCGFKGRNSIYTQRQQHVAPVITSAIAEDRHGRLPPLSLIPLVNIYHSAWVSVFPEKILSHQLINCS